MRGLAEYNKKRNFKITSEPGAKLTKQKTKSLIFVIQEHHASHLHYDFRLEMEGVLRSWAVPKGVPFDPAEKRLAVEVEDHPLAYAKFHGTIPAHQYGAGEVYIWDSGTWEPEGDPAKSFKKGKLEFTLKGKKCKGRWMLLRTHAGKNSKPNWLLIKRHEDKVVSTPSIVRTGKNTFKKTKAEEPKDSKKKSFWGYAKKSSSAVKGNFKFIAPELAQLVDSPPTGKEWLHETKFDGYRLQAHIAQKKVCLLTRREQDWTHRYSAIAKSLEKFSHDIVLDGEVVWVDHDGHSNFQKLQNAMQEDTPASTKSLIYYVFDILSMDGNDVRQLPLINRKELVEKIVKKISQKNIKYSKHFDVDGDEFLEAACKINLEGIMSKRANSVYVSGRHDDWVKSKCQMRQEFVIGGFTDPQGAREEFGALLLGVYEKNKFRYVGRVGTGFNRKSLVELKEKITPLIQKSSPFEVGKPVTANTHWVKPQLVAEVVFGNWTDEKILRVPVFQGLREDKDAKMIQMETPQSIRKRTKKLKEESSMANLNALEISKSSRKVPERKISHPEKIYYKAEKITKAQVYAYHEIISDLMLPHISDRPLSLVRCPEGSTGECFFQKHAGKYLPPNVDTIMIKEKKADREYMTIHSKAGLLALIQHGSMELHTWNSRRKHVHKPDQFIMDFDPSPGISWAKVKKAVFDLKEILDHLDLKSFIKLSGGKGVHVHVPISPIYTYDQVKEFSHALATQMMKENPNLYTDKIPKAARKNKIFVDYLRNGQGATAVVPYGLRAREKSAVAMPIEWNQLEDMKAANYFTLEKALDHLKRRRKDPWKDYFKVDQKISLLNSKLNLN